MTCDHVGKLLLPQAMILQIIGRLAFPIFAYMIAEGCYYTRSRAKYLRNLAAVALLCQIVYFVAMGSLYQCIMVTFSLSVLLIFGWSSLRDRPRTPARTAAVVLLTAGIAFFCGGLPYLLPHSDFAVDYGLVGVMTPVVVYFCPDRMTKLTGLAGMLAFLSLDVGGIQWWSLAAVPLLMLYNGERGAWRLKHFFYLYYPLHLAVIYLIWMLLHW